MPTPKPPKSCVKQEQKVKIRDMKYRLDPELYKMLKFADAEVFNSEEAVYDRAQILKAFDLLVTRLKVKLGPYTYNIGNSKVLARTFGTTG